MDSTTHQTTPAAPKPQPVPQSPTVVDAPASDPSTIAPAVYTQSPAKNSNDPEEDVQNSSGTVQFALVTGALFMAGSLLGVVLPRLWPHERETASPETELKYMEMS